MKSTDVYHTLREIVAPWCKTQGFKPIKAGLLGYYRSRNEGCLVFWFQCGPWGWDNFEGSGFVLEFQVSEHPIIGSGTKRTRLPLLLNNEQLERLRQLQNQVISRLTPPPQDHPIFRISPEFTQSYLARFRPVAAADLNPGQFWHRYYSVEDVARWGEYILELLPGALKRFELDV